MGFNVSRELLRSASRIAIAAATASLLTGCSSAGIFGGSRDDRASAMAAFEKSQPESEDFVGGAAYWGAKYEANRQDTTAALNFARNLRMMGGARQAVAVLKEIVMKSPDNPKVMAEYGKALTAAGRFQDAIPFLARASQMDSTDWSTLSTYGVALDQSGNHTAAQENYKVALKISPDNPTIESNLAMSHVLAGRVGEGETILRRLVSRPDATAQMRQNLAMIESLKGNAAEAEQLARQDLPAAEASNNIAVLKQMDVHNAPTKAAVGETPASEPAVKASEPVPAASLETPAPQQAEVAIIEDSSVSIETAAPSPTPASSRFIMKPIADDELMAPATPKATTAPKPVTPPAKDKVAETANPGPMLRKSQAPISIAASE